jgi:hypothetical protein
MVGIASKTTVWYSTGLFAEPLRWVLVVRDPRDRFKTQALLLCTDLEADPQKALSRLVIMRWPAAGSCWQLEVTFQEEVRRHLAFERQRQ